MKHITADDQITEIYSTFNVPCKVIDARSYEPFIDRKLSQQYHGGGCGLRSEFLVHEKLGMCLYRDLCTPRSMTGYGDLRTINSDQMKELVNDIEKNVREMQRIYDETIKRAAPNAGHGASVNYRPFVVLISNFGWGIHARRDEDAALDYFQ